MNPQARCNLRLLAIVPIGIGIAACGLTANPRPLMAPDQTDDTALTARLLQAQVVVSGTVTAVDATAPEGPPGLSFHNPQWTRATIAVESVEKGTVSGNSLSVFFAASKDRAWYEAPKLSKDQQGVWLVHSCETAKGAPGPAVVDPLDYRPLSELPRIRTLIKSGK